MAKAGYRESINGEIPNNDCQRRVGAQPLWGLNAVRAGIYIVEVVRLCDGLHSSTLQ
jgi:hypothetical protein